MNLSEQTIVRVYITEGQNILRVIVNHLQNEEKVRGVSVFRAISGYGESGSHESSLIDLCLDLPLIIEFFDHHEKIEKALNYVNSIVKPKHIVFWTVQTIN